ncbi:ADP-ribosylation factor GTPase-activating protein AGD3 [Cucumis melo var. makuwa]|uniref:ADP-ribosylation factor GTPase-activating protein AGD3 n=1 Tax=Cucumis melo var. makuwa TaxID=1194695 RepID=A0A5A7TT16_CUCMM|nr:ADP-ribosylation factor GTPase-activating protein AGD3 [Cucumis melo var. makuwa]
MHFAKLDDSPMFRKQIQCLEESAELLRERSLKFYKGCRKYTEGLGEGYDGDIAFASSLETFGGGHNDPISVAFGGPVMTKFTIALREIGTYKEVLRSQVEHMLNDRLLQFVNIDLLEVKEARKRFDKASLLYDQAREKFLSLRKGTKSDVASLLEEELHNARSAFEQARFSLVTALSNVEAKKRFEFLEAVSGTMDAHLRYFKQGYELLHQMEPYINQVLTYAQQSRERSNYEQAALSERMQEYKRQVDRESRWSSNGSNGSPNGDGIQAIGRSSHKMIEEVMQSAAKGKVQTIRQGYLSKRSSNLRGDWKRRFFVLDSRGLLYYYRKQCSKSSASLSQLGGQRNSSELGSGLLSRWLSSHYHGGVHDEKSVAHHTVNLLTSTIKVDADQSDLRFCFRIISPTKSYTLQAESALDQMDWIEKITGVIASLLSSQAPERCLAGSPMGSGHHRSTSESSSFESSDFDQTAVEEYTSERSLSSSHMDRPSRNLQQQRSVMKIEKPIDILRRVCGNDKCADCGAPEPDWASLNLGVLVCIECSGVHRNLGVHISKVRSLTLDVKVWEPSVISLFQSLGNTFANSVWEEMLQSRSAFQVDLVTAGLYKSDKQNMHFISKPSHSDPISVKEKFIHAKYAEKAFVRKPKENQYPHLVAQQIWDGVRSNDKKAVYRHIINSEADVNAVYKQVPCGSLTLAKVMLMQEPTGLEQHNYKASDFVERSTSSSISEGTSEGQAMESLDGCTLLHLACETGDIGMLELLLQCGANVNAIDSRRQSALHHSITKGRTALAKLLLSRIIFSVLLGVVIGLMGSFLFACLIRSFVRYLNKTPILKGPVIFSPIIDPKTLHLALRNENQLLGSNPHGKYYRTILDNGLTIAVKRLEGSENTARKSEKRLTQLQLERLARLRHRNLMSLRAYVGEGEGVWLVYDYVGTGSLEDVMKRVRENEVRLGWEIRLGIAVGVIKGLQYLHFECDPQILHYNLKPSNVMLDGEYEPRLADCGLPKLFSNLNMASTSAYTSPECLQDCRYSDKSDIFSFGMILAVLLTGKDPTDPFFGEAASGGSLGQWLRHLQVAGEAREALDKSIIGEEGEEDEMLMAVRIAVVCLSEQPIDRPSSDELVHMLTQLHSF